VTSNHMRLRKQPRIRACKSFFKELEGKAAKVEGREGTETEVDRVKEREREALKRNST